MELFLIKLSRFIKKIKYGRNYFEILKISNKINKTEQKITNLQNDVINFQKYIEVVISNQQCTYNLHQKVFPKYKNINNGKDVVLIATGPTLNNFKPINNAIYVGVNRAFEYDKVKFDYLFLQDFAGATKTYIDDFINYDAKKFIGYLPYAYFPKSVFPDKYNYCKNIERYYTSPPPISLDNITFTYDISTQMLGESYSIAFSAMQFILWTNPRRIYLVGCDTNTKGYYNSKKNDSTNMLYIEAVLKGWENIKQFAECYYPDTEIISINPVGLKNIFKDQYTD